MTRETLEKDFDEKFKLLQIDKNGGAWDYDTIPVNNEVKTYIFEQMIPKVLEKITNVQTSHSTEFGVTEYSGKKILQEIKQNAKEKFNIDL